MVKMKSRPQCSLPGCGKTGVVRCGQCKVWYCSPQCQEDHWAQHYHRCVPPPPLEWPGVQLVESSSDTSQPPLLAPLEMATKKKIEVELKVAATVVEAGAGSDEMRDDPRVVAAKETSNNEKFANEDAGKEISDEEMMKITEKLGVKKEVADKFESAAELKMKTEKETSLYPPALTSDKICPQTVPAKHTGVLSVGDIVSPTEFSINLAVQEKHCLHLLSEMNQDPGAFLGWKVKRGVPVSVVSNKFWYRGLPVQRSAQSYSVFLLDFGEIIEAKVEDMRPLAEKFMKVPPFAYQVSLAGVAPKSGVKFSEKTCLVFKDMLTTALSSEDSKMNVVFVGQLEGGRWLVQLKSQDEDIDLAELFIERDLLAAAPLPSLNQLLEKKEEEAVVQEIKEGETQPEMVEETEFVGPVLPRIFLPESEVVEGNICYYESPSCFYFCPLSHLNLINHVFEQCQSKHLLGRVSPVPATACLAPDDGVYYRAEILSATPEQGMVKVFLVDYGKSMEVEVEQLISLPEEFYQVPSLVIKCRLRGVKPAGEDWSEREKVTAEILMDVGRSTVYRMTDLKYVHGECVTNITDMNGGDVSENMIRVEAGVEDRLLGFQLIPSALSVGKQSLIVLSAINPIELYLCTRQQFKEFEDQTCSQIAREAEHADYLFETVVGDFVLAFTEGNWFRAKIIETLPNYRVLLELVDTCGVADVNRNLLRKARVEVMRTPALWTKSKLDSFCGRKEEEAIRFGDKVEELMEAYTIVEGVVLEMEEGIARVHIPSVECRL